MLFITKTGELVEADGVVVKDLNLPNVRFHPAIAPYRAVVERAFRRIKSFRILESPWMSDTNICRKYFVIVCAMVNYIFESVQL